MGNDNFITPKRSFLGEGKGGGGERGERTVQSPMGDTHSLKKRHEQALKYIMTRLVTKFFWDHGKKKSLACQCSLK